MPLKRKFKESLSLTSVSYAHGVPITALDNEIATTYDGDQMRIQAPGRVPWQKVWLWNQDVSRRFHPDDTHANNYNPLTDGPAATGVSTILPTESELTQEDGTEEWLEIGLVIGRDPRLCSAVFKREAGEPTPPVMDRDWSALRAFVHIKDQMASNLKYAVGVAQTHDRLIYRWIKKDYVFFYPEYLLGTDDLSDKNKVRNVIVDNIKHHSARQLPQRTDADDQSSDEDIDEDDDDNDDAGVTEDAAKGVAGEGGEQVLGGLEDQSLPTSAKVLEKVEEILEAVRQYRLNADTTAFNSNDCRKPRSALQSSERVLSGVVHKLSCVKEMLKKQVDLEIILDEATAGILENELSNDEIAAYSGFTI